MAPARETVGQHFDAWAASYDEEIRALVPRYEEIHDTLVALLKLRPPHRVLDLGTGTGATALRVLEALPRSQLMGLDVSSEMLSRARQRLRKQRGRWTLRQSDLASPTLDGLFDAIVSVLAVHHLWADEKRHLFSRLWEHLAPGGILVLADVFTPATDRARDLFGRKREPAKPGSHDHPDSAADQLRWLTAAGYVAAEVAWADEGVGVLVAWKAERR
jgi:tRNA (cmo5U34)-methyltransferase